MADKVILCDCRGTQRLNADVIGDRAGVTCSKVHTFLCGDEIAAAETALQGGPVMIACQQEAARFTELADELDAPAPSFVDLRDRAGWSDDLANPGNVTAKQAALLAEARLPVPAPRALDVTSHGTCVILGAPEAAFAAAERLSGVLAVTVLLEAPVELDAPRGTVDVIAARLRSVTGTLGNFTLRLDAVQQMQHGGRGAPAWTEPRDGGQSACDIILDLRAGAAPLFPAHEKRDGYLRADPGRPEAVAAAVFDAGQMVGTFEKTLHVRVEPALCAHSRAEKTACTRCLDLCPTGAISSAGEHVVVDPLVCAGCGGCSSVCPSGAISYDAPPVDSTFRRLATLAKVWRAAGGQGAPRLLVHDPDHGREMIALLARHGDGLPDDVIPFELPALGAFGHAEMLAALSTGFGAVALLPSPKTEQEPLDFQIALARAIAGDAQIDWIDVADPDALGDALRPAGAEQPCAPVLPIGTRRQVTRVAAKALQPVATEPLPLPDGAPYGAVLVDTDACTLCLSCVSLCPSGALGDNPDQPQLLFQEDACLQCGLCANICPESAITLEPRLDLSDAALSQRVLHEEQPAACIECGALFGVQSTIDRIMDKLAGTHPMFATSAQARMIQMCDNCRVQAQFHSTDNPFASKERPKVRTTEDYLSKRKDH